MADRPKSYEEYRAVAMLLGRRYDRDTHTFYRFGLGFANEADIDADTLEPLTADQLADRMACHAGYMEHEE